MRRITHLHGPTHFTISLSSVSISMFMHFCAVSPFWLDACTLSVSVIASTVNFPSVWVSQVIKENHSCFQNSEFLCYLWCLFVCLVSVSRAYTGTFATSNLWNESKPFGGFVFTIILVSVKLPSVVSINCF